MLIQATDFNEADRLPETRYEGQWQELEEVLTSMPLFLKASDQAGLQGSPIFDPVGTNEYLKASLSGLDWQTNLPIPPEYRFLGTDVDFFKAGLLAEAQFSNYPFLLNNVLRSGLFVRADVRFVGERVGLVVIITKAHMFPSSNSTLYYEQGRNQLEALARYGGAHGSCASSRPFLTNRSACTSDIYYVLECALLPIRQASR